MGQLADWRVTTEKAKDLVMMGVAKVRPRRPYLRLPKEGTISGRWKARSTLSEPFSKHSVPSGCDIKMAFRKGVPGR